MEAEDTPDVLLGLVGEITPAPESLERIYRGIGTATLEAEAERLRERLLDIGGRVITINQVLETR